MVRRDQLFCIGAVVAVTKGSRPDAAYPTAAHHVRQIFGTLAAFVNVAAVVFYDRRASAKAVLGMVTLPEHVTFAGVKAALAC